MIFETLLIIELLHVACLEYCMQKGHQGKESPSTKDNASAAANNANVTK